MANQYGQGEHVWSGETAALLSRKDAGMERWVDSKTSVNPNPVNKGLTMGADPEVHQFKSLNVSLNPVQSLCPFFNSIVIIITCY